MLDSINQQAFWFYESFFIFISKACAPGVHSGAFEIRDQEDYWEYSHLCDLCHGSAGHYCERNHGEDYFGHTGAFRCLVEGGGNVAFVKVIVTYFHIENVLLNYYIRFCSASLFIIQNTPFNYSTLRCGKIVTASEKSGGQETSWRQTTNYYVAMEQGLQQETIEGVILARYSF